MQRAARIFSNKLLIWHQIGARYSLYRALYIGTLRSLGWTPALSILGFPGAFCLGPWPYAPGPRSLPIRSRHSQHLGQMFSSVARLCVEGTLYINIIYIGLFRMRRGFWVRAGPNVLLAGLPRALIAPLYASMRRASILSISVLCVKPRHSPSGRRGSSVSRVPSMSGPAFPAPVCRAPALSASRFGALCIVRAAEFMSGPALPSSLRRAPDLSV